MELRGTLSDFSLEAIFGLIQSGHKTGTLHLAAVTPLTTARQIDIFFANGEIVSVACGSLDALDAIREAAICDEGSFEFSVDGGFSPSAGMTPLSMDAVLAAIEQARSALASPSTVLATPGATLVHATPEDNTIHLTVEEFRLLAVLRDNMTAKELITAAPVPMVDAIRIIDQLLHRGLLATGAPVAVVDQMTYAGAVSLAEYVGGRAGAAIFSQYFRPGTPVSEWKRALPDFRSAFQSLVGSDKTNEMIAGLREITG